MRQKMSDKNVKKYAKKLNLPIVSILVRGGTDHRKDLYLEGGIIKELWPDGSITDSLVQWSTMK